MENWSKYKPDSFEIVNGWIRNWFSNMVISPMIIDGIVYNSVENYFQSHKSLDRDERIRIASLLPSISKKEGRKLKLREDWEEVKYEVMKTALRVKFNSKYWKDELLSTGDSIIIEWNNWNDKIWGVPINNCIGENLLGKALMEIREELKNISS